MTMTHARESFAGRLACSGEGKLLRIEGDNYFVKNRENGKAVRQRETSFTGEVRELPMAEGQGGGALEKKPI